MSCTCRIWEVVGAINGYCTYSKQGLTRDEAQHFIYAVGDTEGVVQYFWPDGEGIVASLEHSAFWARVMHDHKLSNASNQAEAERR